MILNDVDKKRVIKFFRKNFKKHGTESALSLTWDSKENQIERFNVLCLIGDLSGKSILDVGCGLGDLYGYCAGRFKKFSYLGIDVLPDFIDAARVKYPRARFENMELLEVQERFDFVFASGSLTFKIRNAEKYYFAMIKKMYALAKIGVAFNMLDTSYYISDDFYLTYNKKRVLEYCKTFAKNVKIITGYLEGDFTVYLLK
jgi:trans-aconitate methyltransferase